MSTPLTYSSIFSQIFFCDSYFLGTFLITLTMSQLPSIFNVLLISILIFVTRTHTHGYIYIYIYIVRRTRHAGHCWRSKDELISDVILWTPTYGRAKAGRPVRTYIQHLCEDTGCSPVRGDERQEEVGKEDQGYPC